MQIFQIFSFLSDGLLLIATVGMAAWCHRLRSRLRTAKDEEGEVGATVAALRAEVDALKGTAESLRSAIDQASQTTCDHEARMNKVVAQADDRIGRMEMLLASLEDLEEDAADRLLDPVPAPAVEEIPSFRPTRTIEFGGRTR